MLMAFPGADIRCLSAEGIEAVAYTQTEHYRVTKMFLDDPEQMLHYLLEAEDEKD